MDRIDIKKLKIFAHHGVLQEEKEEGQYFYVNARLTMDLRPAGINDALEKSINYDEAAHLIQDTVTADVCDTIEAVAENVATALLLQYRQLKSVLVTIEKPDAPIRLDFQNVSVTVERGWHTAYLGIGSNMGDREEFLNYAVDQLSKDESIFVKKVSKFINTEPYGPVEQPDFLNGAVDIQTILAPHELLSVINDIEKDAGRERKVHWGPRTLDIDILLYEDTVIADEKLIIPHKEMTKREFVLKPLAEIAPFAMHPIFKKTISELLEDLRSSITEASDISFHEEYTEVETILNDGVKVVYAGVPGAYAEEAGRRYFGTYGEYHHVKKFDDVVSEVASGDAEFGIIPIENSSAGFVSGNYDIIRQGGVNIVAEVVLDISHCLLGVHGSVLSDVKKVISHPQGLMQCKEFLDDNDMQAESVSNTALAARKVKELNDKTVAAIASERAAELYDLKVLKHKINFSDENSTKFVIISRDKIFLQDAANVSICFTAAHKVGALYDIMRIIFENRLNMTLIESRPSLRRKWEYMFYVEFEGKLTDRNVKKALGEIEANTDSMTLLGTY